MASLANLPEPQQRLKDLQAAIRKWERKSTRHVETVISTGCHALDELFPDQGIHRGSLVEWLAAEEGCGAVTLSLVAGRAIALENRPIVLIDWHHELSPLALQAMGMNLKSVVLIRPARERDALWACEEALRCPGVGLVWIRIDRLSGTSFRRLQLAAEEAGTIGFLLRPESALRQPSWADARLMVRPVLSGEPSLRLQIEVAYSQGRSRRSRNEVRIDNMQGIMHDVPSFLATHPVPVVS
jgi:protein ImuA